MSEIQINQKSEFVRKTRSKIGFLVNPYAGIGGPQGLKGSDSEAAQRAADKGEIPFRAPLRVQQFLSALNTEFVNTELVDFYAVSGAMGGDALREQKLNFIALDLPVNQPSTALDTCALAEHFLHARMDLLVFVGGDGTARDICRTVGTRIPVLGVPSGVKMHSGVFAITPLAAAKVVNDLVADKLVSLLRREVRDIDEVALLQSRVTSRYFGEMLVPDEIHYMQSVKNSGVEQEELVLCEIADEIKERLEDEEYRDASVIFSGGSTTFYIEEQLGCAGSLLGVDVYRRGQLIKKDVSAAELEDYVLHIAGKVILVLTAIGGQGHIIGRGNQQLTPKVLQRVGRENLWVVATKTKLNALQNRPLLIDSNDPELDKDWRGFIQVITGYRDHVLYRLD